MCNHTLHHTDDVYISSPWMDTDILSGNMKIRVYDREEKEKVEWGLEYGAGQLYAETLYTNIRTYFEFGSGDAMEQFGSTTIDEYTMMKGVYF